MTHDISARFVPSLNLSYVLVELSGGLYPSRLQCVPDVIPHFLVRHLSTQLLLQGGQPHQHLL